MFPVFYCAAIFKHLLNIDDDAAQSDLSESLPRARVAERGSGWGAGWGGGGLRFNLERGHLSCSLVLPKIFDRDDFISILSLEGRGGQRDKSQQQRQPPN